MIEENRKPKAESPSNECHEKIVEIEKDATCCVESTHSHQVPQNAHTRELTHTQIDSHTQHLDNRLWQLTKL